jgi:hypothetical protein
MNEHIEPVLIIGILVSILLAIISSIIIPSNAQFGFIVGLLAVVITLLIDNSIKLRESISLHQTSNAFFKTLQKGGRFSEIILIWGLRTHFKILSNNSIQVDRIYVLDFWRDCIANTKRWCAIDYSKQAWEKGLENHVADSVQSERIKSGGEIKRVFLFDSDQECEKSMKIMKAQEEIGVKVKYIKKQDLEDKLHPKYTKIIKTLSFAIADDSWVYREFYDEKRNLTHAEILSDQKCIKIAQYIFDQAFINGKNLSSKQSEQSYYPLRGTVIQYIDPTEPVTQNDWEVEQ